MMQEMYLELALYSLLNLRRMQWQNRSQLAVTVVGCTGAFFTVFLPVIVSLIIERNWHKLDNKTWLERNETLIENTRVVRGKILNQYVVSVFFFRRLTYAFILVFLTDYPAL